MFGASGPGRHDEIHEREPLADRLRGILLTGNRHGALIRGQRGSGKRHAVEKAIVDAAYSGAVYRLAGTRYGRDIEYGALHFLLVDLDETQITSPVIVFGALRKRFVEEPVPPLFILENLAFLDPWSTAVLAQLAQAGLARLFVLDDFQTDIPEDLRGLVRTGVLVDYRVRPLSLAEVEEVIGTSTSLKPSSLVTATLWAYSQGNAEWLDAMIHGFMADGTLCRSNESLVISEGPLPLGPKMLEIARSRFERLSPVQRSVLELVAHSRLAEPRLLEGYPTGEVDQLHADGILEYIQVPNRAVRLSSRVLEDCLRAMMSKERTIELDDLLKGGADTETDDGQESVDPEMRSVGGFPGSYADMIRGGGSRLALELVTQTRGREYGDLSAGTETHGQSCKLTDQTLKLLALELRLSLRTGNDALVEKLVDVLDPIRNGSYLHHLESPELHEAAASLLETLARADRYTDAVDLVCWLTEVCLLRDLPEADRLPEPCLPFTVRAILATCLTLGEWGACRELVEFIEQGRVLDPSLIAFAGTIKAILQVASGDFEAARDYLIPVEQQLLMTGPPEEHEAVAGILAYCHSELGQSGKAANLLTPGEFQAGTNTPYGWVAEYFRALALRRIHSLEAGRSRLTALERISESKGESLFRTHALAALVRMGDREAAVKLLDLCRSATSVFANPFELLARGVLEEQGALITESLQLLIDLGFAAFAGGEENAVHQLMSPAQRRAIARACNLRRQADSSGKDDVLEQFGEGRAFDLLTKRERFVASAAARGLSNLEIAEKASVSVRTIEGHLYQIYSKLTIKGRTDLHNMAVTISGGTAGSNA